MSEVNDIIMSNCAAASTICAVALLIKWYRMKNTCPPITYISIQQIWAGTLQLICLSLVYKFQLCNMGFIYNLGDYMFLLAVCWSFIASSFVFALLVRRGSGIKYNKRTITALTMALFLIIVLMIDVVNSYAFSVECPNIIYLLVLRNLPMVLMMIVNFFVFLHVLCRVCAAVLILPREETHDVGIIVLRFCFTCEIPCIGQLIIAMLYKIDARLETNDLVTYLRYVTGTLFGIRLILHSMYLLFSKWLFKNNDLVLREKKRVMLV